jgi:gliding motility-associated-like protein
LRYLSLFVQLIMPGKTLIAFFLLLFFNVKGWSQVACSTLGQTPSTAFPVCGTSVFNQLTVPQCTNNVVPASTCGSYPDTNPFWYRFTCYQSGSLGFTITPNNLNDDYDWEVFDITGHDPNDVYTNASLFLVANWSGNSSIESTRGYTGITGTSSTGINMIECGTNPQELGGNPPYSDAPTFSKMPNLIEGHTYLLLVSHFTQTQSGYGLSFGGGSAVITDTTKPAMQTITTKCDAQTVYLKLNKKMKCGSLAADGSDFAISPANAKTKSAMAAACSSGFDMDSVIINLDKTLPPGTYSLIIRKGSDANTLLDVCDNDIPEFDSVPFTVLTLEPTPMDSLSAIACAPDTLQLVFKNGIRCSSVAADGSDFIVQGSAPVSVARAFGVACDNGISNAIKVVLNKPIETDGTYNIILKRGSDGNTLLDECTQETPAGSAIAFKAADTVSADFSYRVGLGCVYDTLLYAHDGRDHVNQWSWTFDADGVSTAEDSIFLFKDYGAKHIQLSASNGVCSDSASADILLDNQLAARFVMAPSTTLCPEDAAVYTDSSIGKIVSWYWVFGDGTTSIMQNPPPKKYDAVSERDGRYYPVALIVKNDINCFDTSQIRIRVLYNCYIDVPTAFTPNGDGLNDYLYPLNAYKAQGLEFRIYNRYGQMVFETTDWTKKWDGKINGKPQASGTYVWMLNYTNQETGKEIFLKGTSVLIR